MVKLSDYIYTGSILVSGSDKEKRAKIKNIRILNPNVYYQKKSKGKGLSTWRYATYNKRM